MGISSEKVILLDNKSKLLAKTQSISDLDEWRTGSGKCHDGLVLEFRGAKTWTLSMLTPDSLKSVTAVLWDALDMHGRFVNSSTLRRESFEFGMYIYYSVSLMVSVVHARIQKVMSEGFQI